VIDWHSVKRVRTRLNRAAIKVDARSGYDLLDRTADYELQLRFEGGEGVQTAGIDHPLARPLRRTLAHGHPPDCFQTLLCPDEAQLPPRVFGTFVRTLRGRVLFFPAVGTRVVAGFRGSTQYSGKLVDHLTLEPERGSVHSSHLAVIAAGLDERTRGEKFSFRLSEPQNLAYWFSILTPDLASHPRLPALVRARFSSGKRSVADIAPLLASRFRTASVPMPALVRQPSFLQLDVWVGRGDVTCWRQLKVVPYSTNLNIVDGAPKDEYSLVAHAAPMSFADGDGIVAMLWRPHGRLQRPMLMRARLEPLKATP
jgi:hypothetical protein